MNVPGGGTDIVKACCLFLKEKIRMRGNPAHFHQPVALMARPVQRFYPLKMSRNSFFEWECPARPGEGSAPAHAVQTLGGNHAYLR